MGNNYPSRLLIQHKNHHFLILSNLLVQFAICLVVHSRYAGNTKVLLDTLAGTLTELLPQVCIVQQPAQMWDTVLLPAKGTMMMISFSIRPPIGGFLCFKRRAPPSNIQFQVC